jgi:tryptophan-rich sensory protein
VIILNLIASIVLWLDIYKYNKNYAYFVAIYPIWLSIATTLNLAIWILN